MNMMAVKLTALSLVAVSSITADTQRRPTAYQPLAGATYASRMVIAQGDVRIPNDAQLERMEERAITTPPVDARDTQRGVGGEEAEIRQMDERAHRIDEQLMGSGAICTDCK
jgi:hypothetical protein